jgi:prephenate dehydratase
VGYLGPPGTFTEEALLASARRDAVEPVGLATIYDTLMALGRGELEWAVVPIENSLEGSISVTLDLLAEESERLEIVGEALLAVKHSLIAPAPVPLGEIQTIITHPQVPGQCRRFLRAELAHARVLSASSTAEAVRLVVTQQEPGVAALGTLLAAEIYGGTVLRRDVQDRDDNETRFLWIGPRGLAGSGPPLAHGGSADGHAAGGDPDAGAPVRADAGRRTSLVFWGAGAERPGWLVRCLDVFARREINLSRIESRPRRERMGHYMFFVDLQGDLADEAVAAAVEELASICEDVLVLGSYPRA